MPGKSEQQKTRLAVAVAKVMEILHYGEESVNPQDWVDKVHRPDIKNQCDKSTREPGYDEKDL